jgi:hypothetical protein
MRFSGSPPSGEGASPSMKIEILAEGLDEVRQYLNDHHDDPVDHTLASAVEAEDMAPGAWWAGLYLSGAESEKLIQLTYRDEIFRVERCSTDEYQWWTEADDDQANGGYGDFTIEYVDVRPAKSPTQPAQRRNQPRRRTRRQRSRHVQR